MYVAYALGAAFCLCIAVCFCSLNVSESIVECLSGMSASTRLLISWKSYLFLCVESLVENAVTEIIASFYYLKHGL